MEMIISSFANKEVKLVYGIIDFLLFGFSVSIDSFTVGIGFNFIYNDYLFIALVFMIFSGLFTYLGLLLGNKIKLKYGNIAKIIGGFLLLIMSIYYFFKTFV